VTALRSFCLHRFGIGSMPPAGTICFVGLLTQVSDIALDEASWVALSAEIREWTWGECREMTTIIVYRNLEVWAQSIKRLWTTE